VVSPAPRALPSARDGSALALLAVGILGGRLAEGDLIGDPVIYAAVAKSVLLGGDWMTLHLAGRPFFDKPPLVIWLAALSFKLFGISVWSARLPAVALAVGSCLVLWRLGTVLFDERVGLAAGAVLALTPGFVRFGSTLLLDPALVFCALAGLLVVARDWERGGRRLWVAGAWFGAGFLGKGALGLAPPAAVAALWLASPAERRPRLDTLAALLAAFLIVVVPWHAYETWLWGRSFVNGYLYDITEKLGPHPSPAVYLRALAVTTLPWLPVAAVGAGRSWRRGLRGLGVRLLTTWTLVAYGMLLVAGKHSPRYLMLLHPALALWAALAFRAVLPEPRRLAIGLGAAAVVVWAVMLGWPRPVHPGGTGAAVAALGPALGPPGAPLFGFRLRHEGTRARFAFYADREDVRTFDDPDALARLVPGTPVVTALRDAHALAADGRFEEVIRTRDFAAFRVLDRSAPAS